MKMDIQKNHRRKKIMLLLLVFISVWISFGMAELILRAFYAQHYSIIADEKHLSYGHDDELGWFPVKNSQNGLKVTRKIIYTHNSKGFRDIEHGEKRKPRILFIGDSFVWGYDVEQEERFTEKLRELMPHWDILNCGVSGYGTDQEYLLLRKYFDEFMPDIVFLIFCQKNDIADNSSNVINGGYFKPYFVKVDGKLVLQGVPCPKSIHYFYMKHPLLSKSILIRAIVFQYYRLTLPKPVCVEDPTFEIIQAMNHFVISKGAIFFIGLEDQNEQLEDFLNRHHIVSVQLKNSYTIPFERGSHWTADGHKYVSKKIYDFFKKSMVNNKLDR